MFSLYCLSTLKYGRIFLKKSCTKGVGPNLDLLCVWQLNAAKAFLYAKNLRKRIEEGGELLVPFFQKSVHFAQYHMLP